MTRVLLLVGTRRRFPRRVVTWFVSLATFATASAQSGYWDTRFGPPVPSDGEIRAVAIVGKDVVVGGEFSLIDGLPAANVARWDDRRRCWLELGSGVNGPVRAIATMGGRIYVAGEFTQAGNVIVNGVAAWDGTAWSPVGDQEDLRRVGGAFAIHTLLVDSSGIYAGGTFAVSDLARSFGLARFDTTTGRWASLGGGVDSGGSVVRALARTGDTLYVGGAFRAVGPAGVRAGGLAQLNLHTGRWSAVGGWDSAEVTALAYTGTHLYVGGAFPESVRSRRNLARWNPRGERWEKPSSGVGGRKHRVGAMHRVGDAVFVGLTSKDTTAGLPNLYRITLASGEVQQVPYYPNDDIHAMARANDLLIAAGAFDHVSTLTTPMIAMWLDYWKYWSTLTSHEHLALDGPVYAIHPYGTEAFVGGSFEYAGDKAVHNVAAWNGTTWSWLGKGVDGPVRALGGYGYILVGGEFQNIEDGYPQAYLAKWDPGAIWWFDTGEGPPDAPVYAMATDSTGSVYVGGAFTRIGKIRARGVICYCNYRWTDLGYDDTTGVRGTVHALALDGSNLYVGGSFRVAGNSPVSNIARYSIRTKTWSALGAGLDSTVTGLYATGGNVIAVGPFTRAGDITVDGVARWNGTAWTAVGDGLVGVVPPYAVTTHGRYLAATGGFRRSDSTGLGRLAGYDGQRWIPFGGGLDSTGFALASNNNELYVGGAFRTAGGVVSPYFAIWHGSVAAAPSTDDASSSLSLSLTPNPIDELGMVRFTTQHSGSVRLSIVDALGVERRLLYDGWLGPGPHGLRVAFDGLSSGSFVLRLDADETTRVVPVVVW